MWKLKVQTVDSVKGYAWRIHAGRRRFVFGGRRERLPIIGRVGVNGQSWAF